MPHKLHIWASRDTHCSAAAAHAIPHTTSIQNILQWKGAGNMIKTTNLQLMFDFLNFLTFLMLNFFVSCFRDSENLVRYLSNIRCRGVLTAQIYMKRVQTHIRKVFHISMVGGSHHITSHHTGRTHRSVDHITKLCICGSHHRMQYVVDVREF